MELLNLIIAKPDWETKIDNSGIVTKWKRELANQKTKPELLDLVILLLRHYKTTKSKEYEEYDGEYDHWALRLGTKPTDIGITYECKCKCKICAGMECYSSEESDESDSQYDKDVVCICTDEKLQAKKKAYLEKYLQVIPGLIDANLKHKFIGDAQKLDSDVHARIMSVGKEAIEYQPNTKQKVVNLIHPSLRCYVTGVSGISNISGISEISEVENQSTRALFQWLPAEFEETFKTRINGLNSGLYNDLYDSIAAVFRCFVPKFEKLLDVLNENAIIKSKTKLNLCQVIVKMSNIELAAGESAMDEGAWHLEGVSQENIVATGIYYYDLKNVASHALEFRTTMTESSDIDYEQNCSEYVTKHYGMADIDSKLIYNGKESYISLGTVDTVQDLCIVFPNFLQHRVPRVELEDAGKPGHRKILVFFLIHPDKRILSTLDVAEQTISDEDARLYRELLMFQRKFEISDQCKFFERGWSLCEH